MSGNTFGRIFKLSTFGESHGEAIGGVIDGCPAGLEIDKEFIQLQLDRRKPGQSHIVTQRKESDTVNFLSGVFEGKSTGAPIGFVIYNENQKSKDYDHLKENYRPSHADYVYDAKYGFRDYRGGGRSSARETACRVVGGSLASLFLKKQGIEVVAYVSQVGHVYLDKNYNELDLTKVDSNIVRCPDEVTASQMIEYIEKVKKHGDTVGGIVTCVIKNVPVGLGEPVFDKLHAQLGYAMLGINAVKGFEFGSGFEGAALLGSQHNDEFFNENGKIVTKTNHSGGIQGGISNGQDIYFNVAFKPVATIMQMQNSVNNKGDEVAVGGQGRHDPCVLPRAVPIIEAMASLVVADNLLLARSSRV